MNNLWGVQQSIYSALTTAPATYRVYDAVPQSTTAVPILKPFIVIGEYTMEPDEEIGTVTTDAAVQIHTWSATAGKKQSHEMLQFIRERLDGQPVGGAWLTTEDFAELMEDEGSTAASRLYHGIARYRIRVEDGAIFPPLGQFDMGQFA